MKEALLLPPPPPPPPPVKSRWSQFSGGPLNWLQRLIFVFKVPKDAPVAATNPVGTPRVSSRAVLSARRALQWIKIIPGGARIIANIDEALEIVDGFDAVSTSTDSAGLPCPMIPTAHISLSHSLVLYAPQISAQDAKVRRRLEYYALYLVELLEPLYMMRGHDISERYSHKC